MDIKKEIAKFERDWEVDFGNLEMRIKQFGFWRSIKEFFWPTEYLVLAMYSFARGREAQPDAMAYPHIVNSDNLIPIEGIPTRIELNYDWSIPEDDLEQLVFGPLTKGTDILVQPAPEKFILLTLGKFVEISAALATLIMFLFWLFSDCQ